MMIMTKSKLIKTYLELHGFKVFMKKGSYWYACKQFDKLYVYYRICIYDNFITIFNKLTKIESTVYKKIIRSEVKAYKSSIRIKRRLKHDI